MTVEKLISDVDTPWGRRMVVETLVFEDRDGGIRMRGRWTDPKGQQRTMSVLVSPAGMPTDEQFGAALKTIWFFASGEFESFTRARLVIATHEAAVAGRMTGAKI